MADKKISALTAASTPLAGTEVLPIVQSGATVKVAVSDLTSGRAVSALSLSSTTKVSAKIATSGTYYRVYEILATGGTAIGEISYSDTNDTMRIANLSNYANTSMTFYVNAADRVEIMPNGDVKALNGNVVIGTSGKGIDFSATPGTGTSELLADYEEGTWTVALYDAASAGNASATTVTGYYTRVGNLVTCSFSGLNAISTAGMTAGNTLYIGNLPFTASSTGIGTGSFACENFAFGAGRTNAIPVVLNSNTRAIFRAYGSGTSTRSILVSDVTSGSANIDYFTVSYRA